MPAAAGGTLTITPQWGGAKKRSYFNAFDLDRTEKGFVVSRFAFVRFGDCLDCMTIVLAETLVGHARTILLDYVKTVGLQAVKFDLKTPEIPRFAQGTVERMLLTWLARTTSERSPFIPSRFDTRPKQRRPRSHQPHRNLWPF
jgi:hypothetical protein